MVLTLSNFQTKHPQDFKVYEKATNKGKPKSVVFENAQIVKLSLKTGNLGFVEKKLFIHNIISIPISRKNKDKILSKIS